MQLLKVKEAAKILSVSEATVYKLMMEKQIPHVNVGGRKQINQDDLERYIKANTSKPVKMIKKEDIPRFKYTPGMRIV